MRSTAILFKSTTALLALVFTVLFLAMFMLMASAQTPMPKTIKLHNNATGEALGSVTIWQNKLTMRDAKGELVGTIIVAADGSRTFFDPNGKQVDNLPLTAPTND